MPEHDSAPGDVTTDELATAAEQTAAAPAAPEDTAAPDQTPTADATAGEPEYISYEQFGRNFFEFAVTEDRIAQAFESVAGEQFQVGPLPSGPGGLVNVKADVKIDEPAITRDVGQIITFTVHLPLSIGLLIDLKLDRLHYDVDGLVTLPLTVRCVDPLTIVIDVAAPAPRDVFVDVASRNMRGEIIRNLAQVDAEIRRVIAKTVATEIKKPEVQKACNIDVAAELSKALD